MEKSALSEQEKSNFDYLRKGLESTIEDPEIIDIMNDLEHLEQAYNSGSIPLDFLKTRVNTLSRRWPLKGEEVHLSGEVFLEIDGRPSPQSIDDKVVSLGLSALLCPDEHGKPQCKTGYWVLCRQKNRTRVKAFASPDNAVIDNPRPSAKLSRQYLEYFEPELLSDVDGAFERYRGSRTSRALALRSFVLAEVSGDRMDHEKFMYLSKYINSEASLDPEPYKIEFNTDFIGEHDMELVPAGAYMADLSRLGIRLKKNPNDSSSESYKPIFTLLGRLVSRDLVRKAHDFEVPLDSIKNMVSCRDMIYDN